MNTSRLTEEVRHRLQSTLRRLANLCELAVESSDIAPIAFIANHKVSISADVLKGDENLFCQCQRAS